MLVQGLVEHNPATPHSAKYTQGIAQFPYKLPFLTQTKYINNEEDNNTKFTTEIVWIWGHFS